MSLISEYNSETATHFDQIAENFHDYKKQNHYYHSYLKKWCLSQLPPERTVLDVGCGRGDVLHACNPSKGVGIDLSEKMIEHAQQEYSDFQFESVSIEDFKSDEKFENILLINTLEYTYDVNAVFAKLRDITEDNGRLFISTANPLWSGIFKMASKMGLRIPECHRLFLTNKDVVNLLNINGFEVQFEKMVMLLPKKIPIISNIVNWFAQKTPIFRLLCSTQIITARKIPEKRKEFSVSVIVPCHNELGNIERILAEVPKFGKSTELIFVDDGSSDGTADFAKKGTPKHDIHVKVLDYSPNHGKGYAVKQGFDAAKNEIVFILDADLTTHPEELEALYEAFAEGKTEFVNCTRMIYPMQNGAMKLLNYIGNKCFTILVSWVMTNRVSDTLCGTKAMFRKDYQFMEMGRDPWGDYDFLFGAAQLRLTVTELPIHYRERLAGLSKMNSFKHTINLLKSCFRGFFQVHFMNPLEQKNKICIDSQKD